MANQGQKQRNIPAERERQGDDGGKVAPDGVQRGRDDEEEVPVRHGQDSSSDETSAEREPQNGGERYPAEELPDDDED